MSGPAFGLGLGLAYCESVLERLGVAYGPGSWTPDRYRQLVLVPPNALTGGVRIEVKPDTAEVYVDG